MANFSFRLSPMAARVEKATSRHLIGPDWTVNMTICDAINSDQRKAKDAIKAIKKRLQSKKSKTQFLTLVLLETVMKNCGDYVHQQVIERNILQEMIKIVKKKTEMQVRNKILELLDSWQEAFGGSGGKYPQYYWAYTELRRSGVSFPQRSLDNPPIFTPPAHTALTSAHPQIGYGVSNNTSTRLGEGVTSETGNLSVSDLKHIRTVMELLSDMIQAVNPRDRAAAKDDVIIELVNECRSNQKRLVQLLNSTSDEELLKQGFEINDNLQSLLAKHQAMASGTFLPPEVSKPPLKEKNLISAPVVNNQFEDEEEDDEFAQLARRNSKSTAKGSTPMNKANTFTPNWSDAPAATNTSSTAEGASSSESKALVLLDPPTPVQTRKEEPDMIDLLSLTLTTTSESSPQTPVLQLPSTSATPTGQGNLNSSQSYPVNQGFNTYNSYVAPWAQHTLPALQQQFSPHLQPSQYPYTYPTPQWVGPSIISNPIPSGTYQWVPSHASYLSMPQHYTSVGTRANYAPVSEERQGTEKLKKEEAPTAHSSMPLQNYNSVSLKKPTVGVEPEQNSKMKQTVSQVGYSRPLQSYNSIASNNAPTATGAQQNSNQKHTGAATPQKPYYHPDSLFGDLIDLKSSGGRMNLSSKSTLAAPGQPMTNSRQ